MSNDNFEVIEDKLPSWSAMSKKNADGESVPFQKTDKSYFIGYYLGMDTVSIKGEDTYLHKFQYETCGDPEEHLSEPLKEGDKCVIWGVKSLNDKMVQNVPIGARVRILWTGKVASKANPSFKYHTFEIAIDKSKSLTGLAQVSSPNPNALPPKDTTANAVTSEPAGAMDDEDDSLPF